jgi:acyl dehydratase
MHDRPVSHRMPESKSQASPSAPVNSSSCVLHVPALPVSLAPMHVGQKAQRSLTLTRAEVDAYARITGDFNPLHFDGFANGTKFGRRLVVRASR